MLRAFLLNINVKRRDMGDAKIFRRDGKIEKMGWNARTFLALAFSQFVYYNVKILICPNLFDCLSKNEPH